MASCIRSASAPLHCQLQISSWCLSPADKHDISESVDFLRASLRAGHKKRAVTTLYNVSVTAHIELDF
mgnify:CR=1 FL=1